MADLQNLIEVFKLHLDVVFYSIEQENNRSHHGTLGDSYGL